MLVVAVPAATYSTTEILRVPKGLGGLAEKTIDVVPPAKEGWHTNYPRVIKYLTAVIP